MGTTLLQILCTIIMTTLGWLWVYVSTKQFNRENIVTSVAFSLINRYLVEEIPTSVYLIKVESDRLLGTEKLIDVLKRLEICLAFYVDIDGVNDVVLCINELISSIELYANMEFVENPEGSYNYIITKIKDCEEMTYKFLLSIKHRSHEKFSIKSVFHSIFN